MKRRPCCRRRGNIIVFSAVMMVGLMACLAFAVDIGYVLMARTELQRSADAAAMAAAWDLVDEGTFAGDPNLTAAIAASRTAAQQYAASNTVCQNALAIDTNVANLVDGDVVVGYLANPSDPNASMVLGVPALYNAVQVRVQRTSDQNGRVPLFFASIFGMDNSSLQAEATAGFANNIGGFHAPADGSNLGMLPFALDEQTWNDLIAGNANDNWTYNAQDGTITAGADGVREVNLFPQGVGSPGNRGTIDVGSSNNSTADIARQIVNGVSAADLDHHGGTIELDENGELFLNGDTGISAGVKDELVSIMGKPRVIPIFRVVVNPGDNAQYTIVKFIGIRIMEVQLTGSTPSKRVIIQPAAMVSGGVIPTTATGTSDLIFSPIGLVR